MNLEDILTTIVICFTYSSQKVYCASRISKRKQIGSTESLDEKICFPSLEDKVMEINILKRKVRITAKRQYKIQVQSVENNKQNTQIKKAESEFKIPKLPTNNRKLKGKVMLGRLNNKVNTEQRKNSLWKQSNCSNIKEQSEFEEENSESSDINLFGETNKTDESRNLQKHKTLLELKVVFNGDILLFKKSEKGLKIECLKKKDIEIPSYLIYSSDSSANSRIALNVALANANIPKFRYLDKSSIVNSNSKYYTTEVEKYLYDMWKKFFFDYEPKFFIALNKFAGLFILYYYNLNEKIFSELCKTLFKIYSFFDLEKQIKPEKITDFLPNFSSEVFIYTLTSQYLLFKECILNSYKLLDDIRNYNNCVAQKHNQIIYGEIIKEDIFKLFKDGTFQSLINIIPELSLLPDLCRNINKQEQIQKVYYFIAMMILKFECFKITLFHKKCKKFILVNEPIKNESFLLTTLIIRVLFEEVLKILELEFPSISLIPFIKWIYNGKDKISFNCDIILCSYIKTKENILRGNSFYKKDIDLYKLFDTEYFNDIAEFQYMVLKNISDTRHSLNLNNRGSIHKLIQLYKDYLKTDEHIYEFRKNMKEYSRKNYK